MSTEGIIVKHGSSMLDIEMWDIDRIRPYEGNPVSTMQQ